MKGKLTKGMKKAAQLLADGAVQVLSFGLGLVEDGEISVTQTEEVDKAMNQLKKEELITSPVRCMWTAK